MSPHTPHGNKHEEFLALAISLPNPAALAVGESSATLADGDDVIDPLSITGWVLSVFPDAVINLLGPSHILLWTAVQQYGFLKRVSQERAQTMSGK